MTSAGPLRLFDLAPSPNNMKARIALRYKGLAYERIPVTGRDRAGVVKASGQPLTPVLLHGETVIYDSAAILRYLEANFPGTLRLFTGDYDGMHAIEEWEAYGRRELSEPVAMTFGQVFAQTRNPEVPARASRLLHERTARLEERLKDHAWLCGDAMSAADVTCAPMVYYGMLTPQVAKESPIHAFFFESLRLGDSREATRAWAGRVMAYDV